MIKKMTKYSFVIFHKETEAFLKSLQEIGVVDVTRQKRAIDGFSMEKFEEIAQYNGAAKALKRLKEETIAAKKSIPTEKPQIDNPVKRYFALVTDIEKSKNTLAALKTEYTAALPWGAFTKKNLEDILSLGYKPLFYTVSAQKYNTEWENMYPIYKFNETGSKVYFAVLVKEGENVTLPVQESIFPQTSADVLQQQINELEERRVSQKEQLLSLTNCIEDIELKKDELFANLDLYLANSSSVKKADETIAVFEAFAPTDIEESVVKFLEDNNVYYLKEDAKVEDNPPIKLKNNFFAKLYEPIGELYMLPKYGELDLTVFYAPFYMLFFGFCLGDMGYGLILILAGLFVNFKMPKFANYGKLIAWLGLGTIIIPAISGTIFGAKLYELVHLPENITDKFFNDMQMFWFAILFGIFQIIVARLIQSVYNIIKKNYRVGLNALGWAIAIAWATLAYASTEAGFTYPSWVNYIGLAGLLLIITCGSDAKNPIVRIFKGTFTLYDSTSVFGDVLSYIRLFGLATSGGILGFVVNSIALSLGAVPYVGWLLMCIMLVVGHIFVLLLSSLGAFVHPLRLTFIEFYKNAGFEGGGRAYNPLKKIKRD